MRDDRGDHMISRQFASNLPSFSLSFFRGFTSITAPAASASPAPTDALADLKSKISLLENQNKDIQNQNLYLLAEVENSRRRFERLAKDLEHMAVEGLGRKLLPVADNIRRICASGPKQTVKDIVEAVGMIDNELHLVLKSFKIEMFPSLGEKFNPEMHDAIAVIDPEKEESRGRIIDVIVEGYTLAGKLLRAAKVVVGKENK
jgi:molecular chaperone GrpE